MVRNSEFRYASFEGKDFGSIVQAQFLLATNKKKDSFTYKDVEYQLTEEGPDFYLISSGGEPLAIAFKDIVNNADETAGNLSTELRYAALKAYVNGETAFSEGGVDYTLDVDGNILSGSDVIGYISRFVVQSKVNGVLITRNFKEELEKAIDSDTAEFLYTDTDGVEHNYTITYKPDVKSWSVMQET